MGPFFGSTHAANIPPFSNRCHKRKRSLSCFGLSFVRPRRRLSSAPTADFGRRRAQKLSRPGRRSAREARSDASRPWLDSFEHGGRLERFAAGGCRNLTQHARFHFPPLHAANPAAAHKHQECRRCARKIIGKFNPLILGEVHTAGNNGKDRSLIKCSKPALSGPSRDRGRCKTQS